MINCKQIISGEAETPTCGMDICCFYCDRKDSCEEACGDAKDGLAQKCPYDPEEADRGAGKGNAGAAYEGYGAVRGEEV